MERVRHLLRGNELFRRNYFRNNETRLRALARDGQNPQVLFIGCADSRVIPAMITGTAPGSLFVLRNIGNFVAPYKPDQDYHATAAGIEYAINALNVTEIIVCGHTHCGAVAAMFEEADRGLDKSRFVHARKWLSLGEKARALAVEALGPGADARALRELTEQLSVVEQLGHLLTYPYVAERIDDGTIGVHGWLYDIETGGITCYDAEAEAFRAPQIADFMG